MGLTAIARSGGPGVYWLAICGPYAPSRACAESSGRGGPAKVRPTFVYFMNVLAGAIMGTAHEEFGRTFAGALPAGHLDGRLPGGAGGTPG
jgi:hypothetical protein